MNGFTPADGALLNHKQHQQRSRETFAEVRTHLRHLDVVEQLRWLAITALEYRDQLPALVHAIMANGGNQADIAWLTKDNMSRIAQAWLEWVDLQITLDTDWSTPVYRSVADKLGIVDKFDNLMTIRGITNGKDAS